MQAATELEQQGISAEVIDLVSIKPFDMGTICKSIKKTRKVSNTRARLDLHTEKRKSTLYLAQIY